MSELCAVASRSSRSDGVRADRPMTLSRELPRGPRSGVVEAVKFSIRGHRFTTRGPWPPAVRDGRWQMGAKFAYELVATNVDPTQPLIYLWEVVDASGDVSYRYVGKSTNGAERPLTAYRRNVNNLLAGRPYRKSKPDAFRLVHRRLAEAVEAGSGIRLTYLCNVAPDEDILERERYWQAHNSVDPADGLIDADSVEQRIAERWILKELSRTLGREIAPGSRATPSGIRVDLDGVCVAPPTVVEAWAHQGAPKSAQKHKVMTDALKLVWADRVFFQGVAEKILALSSRAAAGHFLGETWMARALENLRVSVRVVELPPDLAVRVEEAQKRQARGNR